MAQSKRMQYLTWRHSISQEPLCLTLESILPTPSCLYTTVAALRKNLMDSIESGFRKTGKLLCILQTPCEQFVTAEAKCFWNSAMFCHCMPCKHFHSAWCDWWRPERTYLHKSKQLQLLGKNHRVSDVSVQDKPKCPFKLTMCISESMCQNAPERLEHRRTMKHNEIWSIYVNMELLLDSYEQHQRKLSQASAEVINACTGWGQDSAA